MPQQIFLLLLAAFLFLLVLLGSWGQSCTELALFHGVSYCAEEIGCIEVACVAACWKEITKLFAEIFGNLFFRRGFGFYQTDVVLLLSSFFLDSFNLLDFPESIENLREIAFLQSFLEEDLGAETIRTYILLALGMDEVDDVMVFDGLAVDLHLKLVMRDQFEDPLGDVLVYDEVTTCFQHWLLNSALAANIDIFLISFFDSHFGFGRIDWVAGITAVESGVVFGLDGPVEEELLEAVGEVTLGFAVVYFEGGWKTDLVALFLVGSVSSKFKYNFSWQFLPQIDFESPNTWSCTIEGAVNEMMGVKMFEDDFITEMDNLSPFLVDAGPELFLLGFGSGRRFCFFEFVLLAVHLIVDLEGAFGEDLEEGLAVVVDVDHVAASGGEDVLVVVDLEVEVGVGVAEWQVAYDLVVRKVLAFSSERIRIICPYLRFDIWGA